MTGSMCTLIQAACAHSVLSRREIRPKELEECMGCVCVYGFYCLEKSVHTNLMILAQVQVQGAAPGLG